MCPNRWIVALAMAMTAVAPTGVLAEAFAVRPGGDNQVVFVSKAPMETFEGKTSQVEGSIVVDPTDVRDSVSVRVEVDLASLDTGIPRRNQHMRENHLETDKFPRAVFTGVAVLDPASAKLLPGQAVQLDIQGTFSLHGVSRRLRTVVDVTLVEESGRRSLRFQTTFPVALTDYAISRPQFLFLKLANEQQVTVRGVATSP
jgi:polyisoprenoid-binding protein YceI